MKSVHITTGKHLSRRHLLKGAGVALGLPMLEAMRPALGAAPMAPKRFIGVSLALGLHSPNLVPTDAGPKYTPSPYLKSLQDLRKDFTVISGSSHPGVGGGHIAEASIWSACPNKKGGGNNTISLDQLLAKHHGHHTRIPSLVLNTRGNRSPSYTENGAMIPAEDQPARLFARLFTPHTEDEKKRLAQLSQGGQSIMDIVLQESKSLSRQVGKGDREKLDQWFTSVREMEKRLQRREQWIHTPKPKTTAKPHQKIDQSDATDVARAMMDLSYLALQSDSTRFITLHCAHNTVRGLEGVSDSYHSLSHHGLDDRKLDQLSLVEQAMIDKWGDLLRQLKSQEQSEGTLLDHTMVMLTSNLGNASSHNNKNMPVLFGGGKFRHGQHLAFDQKNNYPLPNLYLNILQHAGLETSTFATSNTTMKGMV